MSWRFVYIVLISALLMLGWAMLVNNVGRRRYPSYWLSGSTVFVKPPVSAPSPRAAEEGRGGSDSDTGTGTSDTGASTAFPHGARLQRATTDDVLMAAIEGRNDGMVQIVRSLSSEDRGRGTDAHGGMARIVRSLSRDRHSVDADRQHRSPANGHALDNGVPPGHR